MDRLIYIALILILVSCDKERYTYKDGIKFYYTDNISTENGEKISSLIAKEILLNENKEIRDIKEMIIDSGYFTIVLSIPIMNKVTSDTRGKLRGFASSLSVNQLNETPVHVVVTDSNYNPLGYLTYKNYPTWERYEFQSGTAMIKLTDKCDICWASNIDLILRSEMPEIYAKKDSIQIDVDLVRDTVRIKVSVNPNIDLDKLTKQFNEANSEMFLLTFNSRTSIIQIFDNKTNEQKRVYGVKGRL